MPTQWIVVLVAAAAPCLAQALRPPSGAQPMLPAPPLAALSASEVGALQAYLTHADLWGALGPAGLTLRVLDPRLSAQRALLAPLVAPLDSLRAGRIGRGHLLGAIKRQVLATASEQLSAATEPRLTRADAELLVTRLEQLAPVVELYAPGEDSVTAINDAAQSLRGRIAVMRHSDVKRLAEETRSALGEPADTAGPAASPQLAVDPGREPQATIPAPTAVTPGRSGRSAEDGLRGDTRAAVRRGFVLLAQDPTGQFGGVIDFLRTTAVESRDPRMQLNIARRLAGRLRAGRPELLAALEHVATAAPVENVQHAAVTGIMRWVARDALGSPQEVRRALDAVVRIAARSPSDEFRRRAARLLHREPKAHALGVQAPGSWLRPPSPAPTSRARPDSFVSRILAASDRVPRVAAWLLLIFLAVQGSLLFFGRLIAR